MHRNIPTALFTIAIEGDQHSSVNGTLETAVTSPTDSNDNDDDVDEDNDVIGGNGNAGHQSDALETARENCGDQFKSEAANSSNSDAEVKQELPSIAVEPSQNPVKITNNTVEHDYSLRPTGVKETSAATTTEIATETSKEAEAKAVITLELQQLIKSEHRRRLTAATLPSPVENVEQQQQQQQRGRSLKSAQLDSRSLFGRDSTAGLGRRSTFAH